MTQSNKSISLSDALRHLEIAEANLVKLQRLWDEISQLMPSGPAFGSTPDYEDKCQSYGVILPYLTKIDGWRPETEPLEFDTIGQWRLDALELDEISATVAIDTEINKPGAELRKYRFLLNQKRRQVTREAMFRLIELVDRLVQEMKEEIVYSDKEGLLHDVSKDKWVQLDEHISQIDILLGSVKRPLRWSDLIRHKKFAKYNDAIDIADKDWPIIKALIVEAMYEGDPIPSEIEDLNSLVTSDNNANLVSQLAWGSLTAEQFERLIFTLLLSSEGYENPQWLMQTTAPDRGRDLSVERIIRDSLGSTFRKRIIVQCKHWLAKSVSITDITLLEGQMKLWEPPRVDVCIVATTGRFTVDTVSYVEKLNQSDRALMIELWPESQLEMILAKRPDLIADFRLR